MDYKQLHKFAVSEIKAVTRATLNHSKECERYNIRKNSGEAIRVQDIHPFTETTRNLDAAYDALMAKIGQKITIENRKQAVFWDIINHIYKEHKLDKNLKKSGLI